MHVGRGGLDTCSCSAHLDMSCSDNRFPNGWLHLTSDMPASAPHRTAVATVLSPFPTMAALNFALAENLTARLNGSTASGDKMPRYNAAAPSFCTMVRRDYTMLGDYPLASTPAPPSCCRVLTVSSGYIVSSSVPPAAAPATIVSKTVSGRGCDCTTDRDALRGSAYSYLPIWRCITLGGYCCESSLKCS